MKKPEKAPTDRLWVTFSEAVNWIAYRNFSGWSMGPISTKRVANLDYDEILSGCLGRGPFAFELLFDCAARGRIRLYAHHWEHEDSAGREIEFSVQVDPTFVSKAKTDEDESGEVSLYWESDDQATDERYELVAVDYDDLTELFWGKDEVSKAVAQQAVHNKASAQKEEDSDTAARERRSEHESVPDAIAQRVAQQPGPLLPLTGRGRPKKYKWADFAAATVNQCMTQCFSVQEDLVRRMSEWCIEHWGVEPAISDLRAYVAPIFQAFRAAGKTLARDGAEKSEGQ